MKINCFVFRHLLKNSKIYWGTTFKNPVFIASIYLPNGSAATEWERLVLVPSTTSKENVVYSVSLHPVRFSPLQCQIFFHFSLLQTFSQHISKKKMEWISYQILLLSLLQAANYLEKTHKFIYQRQLVIHLFQNKRGSKKLIFIL